MEDSTACIRATVVALASCQPESPHWQKLIEKFADADIQDRKAQTAIEHDRITTRALTSVVNQLCTSGVLKEIVESGYLDEYEKTTRILNHQSSMLNMVNTLATNCIAYKINLVPPNANEVAYFQLSDDVLYVKIQVSHVVPKEHCISIPNGVCRVICELVKSLTDLPNNREEKVELPDTKTESPSRFIICLPVRKLTGKTIHTFDAVVIPQNTPKIYILLE